MEEKTNNVEAELMLFGKEIESNRGKESKILQFVYDYYINNNKLTMDEVTEVGFFLEDHNFYAKMAIEKSKYYLN